MIGVHPIKPRSGRAVEVCVVFLVEFVEPVGCENMFLGFFGLVLVFVTCPKLGAGAPSVLSVDDIVPVAGKDGEGGGLRGKIELNEFVGPVSGNAIVTGADARGEINGPYVQASFGTVQTEPGDSTFVIFQEVPVTEGGKVGEKAFLEDNADAGTLSRAMGPVTHAVVWQLERSLLAFGTMCLTENAKVVCVHHAVHGLASAILFGR